MPKLNWEIILYNLAEAREEIERIETRAAEKKRPSEIELQIWLEHAYHHLNFAWNVRHEKSERYANLTDEDFNNWSKFPAEMDEAKIEQEN